MCCRPAARREPQVRVAGTALIARRGIGQLANLADGDDLAVSDRSPQQGELSPRGQRLDPDPGDRDGLAWRDEVARAERDGGARADVAAGGHRQVWLGFRRDLIGQLPEHPPGELQGQPVPQGGLTAPRAAEDHYPVLALDGIGDVLHRGGVRQPFLLAPRAIGAADVLRVQFRQPRRLDQPERGAPCHLTDLDGVQVRQVPQVVVALWLRPEGDVDLLQLDPERVGLLNEALVLKPLVAPGELLQVRPQVPGRPGCCRARRLGGRVIDRDVPGRDVAVPPNPVLGRSHAARGIPVVGHCPSQPWPSAPSGSNLWPAFSERAVRCARES